MYTVPASLYLATLRFRIIRMPPLSPDQLRLYQAAARQRQAIAQAQLLQRQQEGLQIAQKAAILLKTQFGAQKVVLFGSLLNVQRMHSSSDIDLAVWGLDPNRYYQAVAALLDLSNFSVDLIEAEIAPLKILAEIQTYGLEL